jgi:hypothetical protein
MRDLESKTKQQIFRRKVILLENEEGKWEFHAGWDSWLTENDDGSLLN